MQETWNRVLRLLPEELARLLRQMEPMRRASAEELRLRSGQRAALRLPEGEITLDFPVTQAVLGAVLEAVTSASLHAVTDQLRRGYLTAPGGIRVGVCGMAVTEGTVRTLRDISSLNLRIPRQISGVGGAVPERLKTGSVLIISPPGGGKTTFLRELVRKVSDGGTPVALADERGELAGMCDGEACFDVGRCTDVLTGAPKAEAAEMLLRAMAPAVVAMDEIASQADAQAVLRLLGCGVRIFATAHAETPEALYRRAPLRMLVEQGAFDRLVRISGSGANRRYEVLEL